MDDSKAPLVEAPLSLLPDLTAWGIAEVDTGICEDTAENRRIIREHESRWIEVFAADGTPTNFIQVVTPEMRAMQIGANKKLILTNDRDPDSDYLTGRELLDEPDSERTVPGWVLAASRRWEEIVDRRISSGEHVRPSVVSAPGRCNAKKIDGHRCANWHGGLIEQGGFCRMHVANRPGEDHNVQIVAKARHRLQSAAMAAVDRLEQLLDADGEPTRLAAARDILDRAGIRGGIEVDSKIEINVIPAEQIVRDRLAKLKAGHEAQIELQARIEADRELAANPPTEDEIVEAVLVEDDDDSE